MYETPGRSLLLPPKNRQLFFKKHQFLSADMTKWIQAHGTILHSVCICTWLCVCICMDQSYSFLFIETRGMSGSFTLRKKRGMLVFPETGPSLDPLRERERENWVAKLCFYTVFHDLFPKHFGLACPHLKWFLKLFLVSYYIGHQLVMWLKNDDK